MKIILIFFLCLGLMCAATNAFAAPVGNIALPAELDSAFLSDEEDAPLGIVGGGYMDFVKDRNTKNSTSDTEITLYGANLGVAIKNRVIVYGTFGSIEFEKGFRDKGTDVWLESESDVYWGGGVTAMIYETEIIDLDNSKLRVGIDFKYRYAELNVENARIGNATFSDTNRNLTNNEIDYTDWQIAGAVSLQWKQFAPYVGIKYSDAGGEVKATARGIDYETDLDSDDKIGLFAGLTVFFRKGHFDPNALALNIEGRFIDEQALSLSVTARF